MGEGWSMGRHDLIPSNSVSEHQDPRMKIKINELLLHTEKEYPSPWTKVALLDAAPPKVQK